MQLLTLFLNERKQQRQYQAHRQWTKRRNHLVCKLMDADKTLLSYQALAMANEQMEAKTSPDKTGR